MMFNSFKYFERKSYFVNKIFKNRISTILDTKLKYTLIV